VSFLDSVGDVASSATSAVTSTISDAATDVASAAPDVLGDFGKWAWEHKVDIGFWAGTSALMLAAPLSGGASGALAGGMMAARVASVGARVASLGRGGAAAVSAARTGAAAINTAKTALGATKVARGAKVVSNVTHDARLALGRTKLGKGMLRVGEPLQKPLMLAGGGAAGANLADTIQAYSHGKASVKDLALSGLAVTGLGAMGIKALAARRAAGASAKAAAKVSPKLDAIADRTVDASEKVKAVASRAPAIRAPQTAGAARAAGDTADSAADLALALRRRAALTTQTAKADGAISATTLKRQLDDVAGRARSARGHAADAEDLSGNTPLTETAKVAKTELDDAAAIAARGSKDIRRLAGKQQRADTVAKVADQTAAKVGTAGAQASLATNTTNAVEHYGKKRADGSTRGILGSLAALASGASSRHR